MPGATPEKSTQQLAAWRDLLDALDQLDDAWQRTQSTGVGTPASSQLPADVAVALVKAAERGNSVLAGVADTLGAQDSGEAFQQVELGLWCAVETWPGCR